MPISNSLSTLSSWRISEMITDLEKSFNRLQNLRKKDILEIDNLAVLRKKKSKSVDDSFDNGLKLN